MFHGQVDIFMDVAFDSLHEDVRLLSFRLSSMGFGSIPIGSLECRLTHFICQQCEASLQFLLLLCQQKLFRDRILKNKVLTYLSRHRFYAIEGKKNTWCHFFFFPAFMRDQYWQLHNVICNTLGSWNLNEFTTHAGTL